jgi:hypothetical protein
VAHREYEMLQQSKKIVECLLRLVPGEEGEVENVIAVGRSLKVLVLLEDFLHSNSCRLERMNELNDSFANSQFLFRNLLSFPNYDVTSG